MDKLKMKKVQEAVEEINKGKAMQEEKQDRNRIIRGKIRSKIQLQDSYKENTLQVDLKETRLFAMKELIKAAEDNESSEITWMGNTLPLEVAKAEYNLEVHYLKRLIQNGRYIEEALKNSGFTDEQITKILEGEYIKDENVLKTMEQVVKNCDDCGEQFVGEGELCTFCSIENKGK